MSDRSLVYWYPSRERHLCGYCKNTNGSVSDGMWAKTLTCEDYQNLIDRGWRRSGCYCYKPVMDDICCPMYTIKCDIDQLQLSKSQKKVMKKFNKYLKDGVLAKFEAKANDDKESEGISEFVYREAPKLALNLVEPDVKSVETCSASSSKTDSAEKCINKVPETKEMKNNSSRMRPKSGVGADSNKPPCKKAKILRLERKQAKLQKRGMSLEKLNVQSEQKSLEDFIHEEVLDSKHKFKLELVNTDRVDEEWENLQKIEFQLYNKYQTIIHNDPPSKCTFDRFSRFLIESPLQITLERLDQTHEYFKLTAALFQKYQICIHNDDPSECDENQFFNFLLETPLQYEQFSKDSNLGFGSFHQLYWLDDKLIAVGVIDILPKCVSAVYFFYDPDYRNLSLGTYGSMRELELCRQLHLQIPSIESYYMGFYIHSCEKMRYKGKLTPSFLLCPETYNWERIEKCVPKLEANRYSRLVDDLDAIDENNCSPSDIDNIQIFFNRNKLIPFKLYKRRFNAVQSVFETIGTLIGQKCAKSLIFIVTEH